MPAARDM